MSRQGMRTFSTEFKEQAVLRELRITVTRPSLPLCLGASLGPGNGILRAETGGGFQAQNAGERPEFCSQTALRLANRAKLREFHQETTSVCRDYMVVRIELWPSQLLPSGASRIWCEKRFDAANVKVARGQFEGANYELPFARKPQISLVFVPLKSNGRDVLKGAQAPAGVTRR